MEEPTRFPGVLDSIADVIGGTPVVELHRLRAHLGLDGRLLCKLEYLNPGFSKKDRVALAMVQEATASGDLLPGQPVVELTSGNTGTGLALVCSSLGHPFVAVMSTGNTPERARMMRALGARVELVEQATGSVPGEVSGDDLDLVEGRARELVHELGAYRADQFERPGGLSAHLDGTGPEIWQQTGGQVDVFCDLVGSGGTLGGVAAYLTTRKPELRAYAVEPTAAAVLGPGPGVVGGHRIQGGGYGRTALPHLDRGLLTGYLQVTDEEAVRAARTVALTDGVFGGYSTGANLAAAVQLLRGDERGATVVVLACDSGLKYLSTDLY